MAVFKEDIAEIDLATGNIHRSFLNHSIGMTDNKADHFGVRVFRNMVEVDLTGVSVQGFFRDPRGNNIAITSGNIVTGNIAKVVLPQACYNYDGQFVLAIKLIGGGVTGTVRIVDGVVDNTNTGGAVAPTETIPTYQEVLSAYEQAVEAVDDVHAALEEIETFEEDIDKSKQNIIAAEQIQFINQQMGGAIGPFDFAHLGKWIDGDGNISPAEGWGYTDTYYEVNPSTMYFCMPSTVTARIAEYDQNKGFISGSIVSGSFTTGSTTKYIRLSTGQSNWKNLFYTTVPFVYNPGLFAYRRASEIVSDLNNAELSYIDFAHDGYWIASNGQVQSATGWCYSDTYYEIDKDYDYYFHTEASTIAVCAYASDLSFIQRATIADDKLTFSNSTKYIRISCPGDKKSKIRVSKGYPSISGVRRVISIGSGQQYDTLRAGIRTAVIQGDTDVYVHPGVYDLKTEFSEEITAAASSVAGIFLGNGVHIIFMDGSYVKANFADGSTWAQDWFSPFYSWQNDKKGFTLEGLRIEASNCHYCVHDERFGAGEYMNKYINCRMKHTSDSENAYIPCIGGGLGKNAKIVIDGGIYDVVANRAPENIQAITFHNGSASDCDSSIFIKDVYITGRLRFSYYGTSTIKTQVTVCGCSMEGEIIKRAETSGSTVDNIEIISWNNEIRA